MKISGVLCPNYVLNQIMEEKGVCVDQPEITLCQIAMDTKIFFACGSLQSLKTTPQYPSLICKYNLFCQVTLVIVRSKQILKFKKFRLRQHSVLAKQGQPSKIRYYNFELSTKSTRQQVTVRIAAIFLSIRKKLGPTSPKNLATPLDQKV